MDICFCGSEELLFYFRLDSVYIWVLSIASQTVFGTNLHLIRLK